MKTGHFYFGKNRTFLNWLDKTQGLRCHPKIEMSSLTNLEMSCRIGQKPFHGHNENCTWP